MRGCASRESILDELRTFFASPFASAVHAGVAAQTYEPRASVSYDPTTDRRLVSLILTSRGLGKSEWARVKRVVDDLSAPIVEVLRLWSNALGDWRSVAACLPSVVAAGRRLADEMSRERAVESFYEVERTPRRGTTGILLAMRVLDYDAKMARVKWEHYPFTLADASRRVLELGGVVDVEDEAHRIIDRALDAYVDVRDRVYATKRAHRAKVREESSTSFDEMMGKKKRKAKAKFESTKVGRELVAMREDIVEAIERLQEAS